VSRKRTRFDIIFEILKISLEKNATKAKIIQRANINSKIATDYVNFLLESELLAENSVKGRKSYVITEKGKRILEKMEDFPILTDTE